ncbi:hypothetical protein NSA56_12930 [Oceanobacillus caeni]|uniref:hypothetical protein n=1 Tax=Bacillaceae TaxID=186817 RepID=UPI0006221777|nr:MULTISPECIES: hypothetical protein [Bacillaceae]KKE80078.1 hypothetical protein WH51_04015 [Bacilli bacterium VT-13-104]PZD85946.1 hypothetical protein DEJ64_08690 [Bacilli bacterium]MBU8790487.1 hypothetical protein [Oceanobacillus caeni]MCR1835301.1 hypothetical protein [Oceanobacillus caeni]MED4475054.1 hypothetical protein [Oceanobacillus caeni]
MINRLLTTLSVALYAFVVSYLVASVFDKYGIETNTILNSVFILLTTIVIIILTVILIVAINRFLVSRQGTDN